MNNHNKPKNVTQMQESFEEHLARMAKSAEAHSHRTNSSNMVKSPQAPYKPKIANEMDHSLSTTARQRLSAFQSREQKVQIFKVWGMLMQAFGSKFTYFFWDELDSSFMAFAGNLSSEACKRLETNLYERLDEDKEWPPSLVRLSN
jgi:hypothetical protein